MAATVEYLSGRLAVIEMWVKGKDRLNLLRSFGECFKVPVGQYVLDIPGQDFRMSDDVSQMRREAARRAYTRYIGNPRIVDCLLIYQTVEVFWWRSNLSSGQSFIRSSVLGSPCLKRDRDDLVVLSKTGKPCANEHGHWMVYRTASRAQLDKADPQCRICLGTGVENLNHVENVCSCVHYKVEYGALKEVHLDT